MIVKSNQLRLTKRKKDREQACKASDQLVSKNSQF